MPGLLGPLSLLSPSLRLTLGPAGFPLQIPTGLRSCCRALALSVILLSSEGQ